ncbi:n-acetyltransferase-related [Holotrichia oblita]|uniref:N-acetyltransferase-related n=2 Tax=Holotrichia oblita TaxID=644536 RepID=A0ACB9TEH6_HOLOL|nr:n-acetyltransferase-related [Holotrichia oblita]KAI4465211.1 n-acetyltransferase-related [Holotrichia oblita]
MSKWSRPTSVSIPTIWATFEGRQIINGNKRQYWIQDITDEYRDRIVEYMIEEFTMDEPLCKYSSNLNHHLGLVCLTKDEDGKPIIAAMNCTTLCSKYDDESSGDGLQVQVLKTLMWVKKQVDPFSKFNITEYLDAMGLYVPPKFRGEGLGYELLKARKALCRACGLKVSITLFTSAISQKLADRVGFKDLYAIDYVDLEKVNPAFKYPGIQEHTKSLRFMYIVYE